MDLNTRIRMMARQVNSAPKSDPKNLVTIPKAVTRYNNIFSQFNQVDASTAKEAVEQAKMDFDVKTKKLHYTLPDGSQVEVPDKVATYRTDKTGIDSYMGTVSPDYGIVQYLDAVEFSEILVADGSASYVAGETIGKGHKGYMVMKTADFVKLDGVGDIECYFYIVTGHDGNQGLDVVPCPVNQVNGTVIMSPREYRIKFKHSKHVMTRMDKARISLQGVQDFFTDFKKSFELFRNQSLTDKEARDYFEMIMEGDSTRAENIRDDMMEIYKKSKACQLPSTKGTLLGAYFAVIEYADTLKTVRQRKHLNDRDAKIDAVLDDQGAKQKAESYGFALQLYRKLNGISVGV